MPRLNPTLPTQASRPSDPSASLQQALARLSSGKRVNSARDDAAALAVASALESQRRSSVVADRNVGDAISMVQTASGALGEVSEIVLRMRELATQSANGALNDGDRASIQAEYGSLSKEIDRIQGSTKFNGKALLRPEDPANPGAARETFQTGDQSSQTTTVDFRAPKIAVGSVDTEAGARAALDALDGTLKEIGTRQSDFGATLNGFDATLSNAQERRIATASAESRLTDADVAEEASNRARAQILEEAKTASLVHALKSSELVLALVKGSNAAAAGGGRSRG